MPSIPSELCVGAIIVGGPMLGLAWFAIRKIAEKTFMDYTHFKANHQPEKAAKLKKKFMLLTFRSPESVEDQRYKKQKKLRDKFKSKR